MANSVCIKYGSLKRFR